ncbi:MAG TPA: DUF1775 domain-containing protein [Gaiellaceae bacterium]|nr:DUF1775 domain-containing protein [Gaiellaceae bacterium]
MNRMRSWKRIGCMLLAAAATALVVVSSASAHARISPPVALAKTLQLYSLAVPTEKSNATTKSIVLTVPKGFSIDSFVPSPGWHRQLQQTGSGENAVIQQVTWTGGNVPTEEDSLFQFLGEASSAKTYTFTVKQTYSDGSIVDWSGPESSAAPAPTIEAKSSLGGGGLSTVTIIALVLGAIGVILGAVALFAGGGKRQVA